MIWAIVSKEEMEGYNIPPVFRYYREVIGKDNIKLAVVDDSDDMDYVKQEDTILLRSANERIINIIKKRNLVSTSENYQLYELVRDKSNLNQLLENNHISVPRRYTIESLEEGKTYFVKPRYGSESFGITKDCICNTIDDVKKQINRINHELNQEAIIEEFIDGVDCTVACYREKNTRRIFTYAIKVECDEIGGIQTHQGKFDYNEYCSSIIGEGNAKISEISRNICDLLNIEHHARIDFRMNGEGDIYMIDVNLLPGLGPSAHFAKCLLLTENLSYKDAIMAIINSATK